MRDALASTAAWCRQLQKIVFFAACVIVLCPLGPWSVRGLQKTSSQIPITTTITDLVESSTKFGGRRVHVVASLHTDGIHRSMLLEPNCGLLEGTSKTPPPGEPQCYRGVTPVNSEKLADANSERLERALKQGDRSTMDKHVTAEFTGIFRCVPSCGSPKHLALEIERVENLKVEMKDLKPHRPTD